MPETLDKIRGFWYNIYRKGIGRYKLDEYKNPIIKKEGM